MNAPFTPDDWEVSGQSIISRKAGVCIAVIEDDGGYEAPADQRIANAHLIAAAPSMLAALRHAHNSLRTFRNVPYKEQQWLTSDDETMECIENAIAKATHER